MKETVPCPGCSLCAIGYGTGFAGEEMLRCSRMQDYVTREDGCTMGEPGTPGTLCSYYDVHLGGHEAVNGFSW